MQLQVLQVGDEQQPEFLGLHQTAVLVLGMVWQAEQPPERTSGRVGRLREAEALGHLLRELDLWLGHILHG